MAATLTKAVATLSDDAIAATFAASGMQPSRWASAPGDVFAVHSHSYLKVLFCLQGSIIFTVPDSGDAFELFPGDRLDIEAGTQHSAVVGADGVTCVEAART